MLTHQLDEHITLKLVDPKMASAIFAVVDANRDHLRTYLPWVDGTKTPADFASFAKQSRHKYADHQLIPLTIFWDDEPIGGIGAGRSQTVTKNCDLGYWLAADHQGKGIITRCCLALIQFVMREWDVNRVTIQCATSNKRSCAVPERLGFTHEGVQRQSHWVNGVCQDMALYSLLASDVMTSSSTN